MKLNERKILEYLESHVGENTCTWNVMAEILGGNPDWKDMGELDRQIRKVAKKNKFRLNADHHYNEVIGLPWVIDFFIERYDEEEVLEKIRKERSMEKKIEMILDEYAIYDRFTGNFMQLREDTPEELKEIYDEYSVIRRFL